MSTTTASPSAISSGASVTSTLSSASGSISSLVTGSITGSITSVINGTITSSSRPSAPSSTSSAGDEFSAGAAQTDNGISLVAFLTALTSALIIFGVQIAVFLLLRNKLARIFKPKTYLVPERERTDPPPASPWGMLGRLLQFKDREIIKKCGLDAYFFLRYLQTLLVIFIPIAIFVIPIIVPLNYSDGKGQSIVNSTNDQSGESSNVTGLDTLAWGNVKPENAGRYTGHLVMAILVIFWVCGVFFVELKVYIKIRQDYLTTAEHRLRASATTVLVNSIPRKWLSERALTGLFDVFPGGIRNVWLTRDLTALLEKIHKRDQIHLQLEAAETEVIKMAKKKQLKKREKEYKKARRDARVGAESKEERELRQKKEDENAKRLAESGEGMSSGAHGEVPQDIGEACGEFKEEEAENRSHKPAVFGKVTGGIMAGVSKANEGLLGGAQFELTNGFMNLRGSNDTGSAPPTRGSDRRRAQIAENHERDRKSLDGPSKSYHSRTASAASQGSIVQKSLGNTVRAATNIEEMYITEKTRWYEFWKPPSGGYASPIPQGTESDEFPLTGKIGKRAQNRSIWQKMNPLSEEELEPVDYPEYKNFDDPKDREAGTEWEKWIKEKDRPTHRLPLFEWTPSWLPGLPFINKKVDTIYWCRKELARLNMEIEYDQRHPERYPLMNSAFIQFNHQVAAHMACQSVTHHVPKHMSPRDVEVSPNDVIWDNMALTWWQEWIRNTIVYVIVIGMIILWAVPVVWSASLSNIDSLIKTLPWLGFLDKNETVRSIVNAAAGVLPAAFLAILLIIIPHVFDFLAGFKGAKTGAQKAETVQMFYFAFLFVQVFLIVSIASGAIQAFADFKNISNTVQEIPSILAENLPKAANYFFSYMILQALSTSSGTLLQIGTLIVWYVVARMFDNTARAKWNRNTKLPRVIWGSFFPVYTNFACIALVYCIVAPIISIFAIITFSLLWIAHRYNMLYVTRFENDTGGVLYPRAINQTFTGLYVMELCLVGLFFLVRDENDQVVCFAHAITMIVMIILTIIYQYLLNRSFAPLFRYLPITFEDEAVLRDEAFQRAQDHRLGLISDDDDDTEGQSLSDGSPRHPSNDIELSKLGGQPGSVHGFQKLTQGKMNPVRGLVHASTWAARGAARGAGNLHKMTFGRAEPNNNNASTYRRSRRQRDLEAQRAIGEALYGGYHDEIEDLTPQERDVLVRHAFQHYALRARRPTVWLPRDDIGVSDDEIKRTREFSEFIWISNEGTALDSNVRVVYGRNPPDFSDVDLINL